MIGAESMTAVFSADEITAAVEGRLVRGDGSAHAAGVSTDTRTLEAGELFIALKGPNFDGAQFLARAVEKGAAGVVVAKGANVPGEGAGFVVEVADTLRALGDLARAHRSRFEIPVAGVTGSNGKTTTKEMIAALLSAGGETCKSQGNLNNLVGLPHQVFRLGDEHANAVFEMGMSEAGEIRRLAGIARPRIAVITNVGPAHIEGLGSVEAVRDAKGEILEAIPPGGVAVLSNEDPHSRVLAERYEATGGRVIRFGFSPQSDFWADEIRIAADGTRFTLHCAGGESGVRLKALGRHNVLNALAAAACASALGVGSPVRWPTDSRGPFSPKCDSRRARSSAGQACACWMIPITRTPPPLPGRWRRQALSAAMGGSSRFSATWRNWGRSPRARTGRWAGSWPPAAWTCSWAWGR